MGTPWIPISTYASHRNLDAAWHEVFIDYTKIHLNFNSQTNIIYELPLNQTARRGLFTRQDLHLHAFERSLTGRVVNSSVMLTRIGP